MLFVCFSFCDLLSCYCLRAATMHAAWMLIFRILSALVSGFGCSQHFLLNKFLLKPDSFIPLNFLLQKWAQLYIFFPQNIAEHCKIENCTSELIQHPSWCQIKRVQITGANCERNVPNKILTCWRITDFRGPLCPVEFALPLGIRVLVCKLCMQIIVTVRNIGADIYISFKNESNPYTDKRLISRILYIQYCDATLSAVTTNSSILPSLSIFICSKYSVL